MYKEDPDGMIAKIKSITLLYTQTTKCYYTYKHIFTGPTSAISLEHKGTKACSSQAKMHNFKRVTAPTIAYAILHAHYMLWGVDNWHAPMDGLNKIKFFNNIVQLLSNEDDSWVTATFQHWNYFIFGPASLNDNDGPGDNDDMDNNFALCLKQTGQPSFDEHGTVVEGEIYNNNNCGDAGGQNNEGESTNHNNNNNKDINRSHSNGDNEGHDNGKDADESHDNGKDTNGGHNNSKDANGGGDNDKDTDKDSNYDMDTTDDDEDQDFIFCSPAFSNSLTSTDMLPPPIVTKTPAHRLTQCSQGNNVSVQQTPVHPTPISVCLRFHSSYGLSILQAREEEAAMASQAVAEAKALKAMVEAKAAEEVAKAAEAVAAAEAAVAAAEAAVAAVVVNVMIHTAKCP
ncbi:hypothetical protein P691DRAFT_765941 [Macrolepiota fuliginosa MF-IS2]|uniref:Uncharacterized protein n=1 Tax=Macrolepiota fuliginosa MF-IS2 TaxID=1400762 RepID=A0A9P5WZ80_9AGAR|nr:hypothetical protein P691DRAFT_765941 [Macrolepiota fuliginosa MF-IS2]